MRRIAAWRDAASIRSGPLFRRVGVVRTKGHPGRRAQNISDLSYNAQIDRERMAAIPPRQASVTYAVGDAALTVAAVRAIIRKRALASADQGLADLIGEDLERALDALSTHSLRVGLTQDLGRRRSDRSGAALVLGRDGLALWSAARSRIQCGRSYAGRPQRLTESRRQTLGTCVNSSSTLFELAPLQSILSVGGGARSVQIAGYYVGSQRAHSRW